MFDDGPERWLPGWCRTRGEGLWHVVAEDLDQSGNPYIAVLIDHSRQMPVTLCRVLAISSHGQFSSPLRLRSRTRQATPRGRYASASDRGQSPHRGPGRDVRDVRTGSLNA